MVKKKYIECLVALSLIGMIVFCTQLASVNAALMQLSNDNGTAEFYHPWMSSSGNIIGAVLTPNPDWSYPIQVDSVQFMLHRLPEETDHARVRVRVYSISNGEPGTLLGSSAPTTITTFWPNWASVSLASANITLSSPDPFMAAFEFIDATPDLTPTMLTDTQNDIPTGKNFYSLDGGATWTEHYDFFTEGPQNLGYNMIRATVDVPPAPATATSTGTPTPTSTSTSTPTPTDVPPPEPTEWEIYLPGTMKSWFPPIPTATPTPTSTPTSTPIPPQEPNIPCLVVVGKDLPPEQPLPSVIAGCVTGTPTIKWRYDSRGAFIGFDLTIKDSGVIIYEASIDIQRATNGRIMSYGGTVSGDGFPDFTENIVNKYNTQGGLVGADVNKVYTASGDAYTMEITQFCPMATANMLTGYKVRVNGQEITIGICP